MSEKEFYQYVVGLKKEISSEVRDVIVPELHLVQDYMKRAMDDFTGRYDRRLKTVENKLRWTVCAIAVIVVLCLIMAVLNMIMILNIN